MWLLDKVIKSLSCDIDIFVLYDVACSLEAHLKVIMTTEYVTLCDSICAAYVIVSSRRRDNEKSSFVLANVSFLWT